MLTSPAADVYDDLWRPGLGQPEQHHRRPARPGAAGRFRADREARDAEPRTCPRATGADIATRLNRLFDRLDAGIGSIGHTLWRAVVEGLAACAMAECAAHDPDGERQYERETVLMISHTCEVSDNDDVRSDFEDLDALMRYVRAIGG
jgi:hypothetical protein